jgi:hypothetical protein
MKAQPTGAAREPGEFWLRSLASLRGDAIGFGAVPREHVATNTTGCIGWYPGRSLGDFCLIHGPANCRLEPSSYRQTGYSSDAFMVQRLSYKLI